ncbi:MAG: hypothetical protein ACYC0N_02445 [Carboxydocellales bacterium]
MLAKEQKINQESLWVQFKENKDLQAREALILPMPRWLSMLPVDWL